MSEIGEGIHHEAGNVVADVDSSLSVISDTGSSSMSETEYSSDSGKGSGEETNDCAKINNNVSLVGTGVGGKSFSKEAWKTLVDGFGPCIAYSKSFAKVCPNQTMLYEFEIPQSLVGRLIGRFGSFVNKIKDMTGANIVVKKNPTGGTMKVCTVEGTCVIIDKALRIVRERFPARKFPTVTLQQLNAPDENIEVVHQYTPSPLLPKNNKLNLIEGVINEVMVCCVSNMDTIFVQHPTHPTHPAMPRLHEAMNSLYNKPDSIEMSAIDRPFSRGLICVTQMDDNWYRVEVVSIDKENQMVTVKLLDVGGFIQKKISELRKIRVDFMTIPFQSTKCRLAQLSPIDEVGGWSQDALNFFKIIAQGPILQATVLGRAEDHATLVYLYKLTEDHTHTFINQEMVNQGYAKWVDDSENNVMSDENELIENFAEIVIEESVDESLQTNEDGDDLENPNAPEFPSSSCSTDELPIS